MLRLVGDNSKTQPKFTLPDDVILPSLLRVHAEYLGHIHLVAGRQKTVLDATPTEELSSYIPETYYEKPVEVVNAMCDLLLNYDAAIPGLKIGSPAIMSQARRDLANLLLYTRRDKMLRKWIHRIHIDEHPGCDTKSNRHGWSSKQKG
jgi:hypothetical protein